MKRSDRLPELLSPAGSPEALYAAVSAGADAVYLGLSGETGNARMGARNFTPDELREAVPYCHAHGVLVYLTLNTLAYDSELSSLLSLAACAVEAGVDALIVADLGLASRIADAFPDVPLHASTQTFTHSTETADALYERGFERVVLARELNEENIRLITARSRAETEVFVHGALCVSHSGECLFSSLVGGRSGNRGACAQPCRLPYNGTYPLSLKDACLAAHIPALIDTGVSSLKIEGRMKSPAYVYTVTRIYRRLLDERRAATEEELARLAAAFSRQGFTDGYFTGTLTAMTGIRTDADKEASQREEERAFSLSPVPVLLRAVFKRGEPSRLSLTAHPRGGEPITVSVTGAIPSEAQSAALSKESVVSRLKKTGTTPFLVSEVSLTLEEGLFLPVSAQNALRRAATDALTEALRAKRRKNSVHPLPLVKKEAAPPLRTALFYRLSAFLEADVAEAFDAVFLPIEDCLHLKEHMPSGVMLPPVITDTESDTVEAMLFKAYTRGARYALVASLGALKLALKHGFIPVGDFRLNATNAESAAVLYALGVRHLILSPELSPARAARIGGGYIVYGRIPLMLTERCFVKESLGCTACGKATLTDRRGVRFPVLRTYGHRATVLNSLPSYVGDKMHVMRELSSLGTHLIFSTESSREIRTVLRALSEGASLGVDVRRAYK